MKNPVWRLTFPIIKADSRPDGLYLVGEASGPEIDAQGERISPEAIESFARQISENELPYVDTHKENSSILHELGVLTKGWLDEKFHLGVEVKLDEDNAAAVTLHKKIQKGKAYGMSVEGNVPDNGWEDIFEPELGKTVRTFKNVILTKIANTTRPAWTPSLGTVLAKAIDEAEEAESLTDGDSQSMEKLELPAEDKTTAEKEAPSAADAVAETPEDNTDEKPQTETEADVVDATSDEAEESSDESAEATESEQETVDETAAAPESTDKSTDADAAPDADVAKTEEIEKAGRAISAATAKRLLAPYAELTSILTELGVLEAPITETSEKSDSENEEENLEKSSEPETVSKTEFDGLQAELKELTARIEKYENSPRTQLPSVMVKEEDEETIEEILKSMSPSERLAFALRASHGDETKGLR